jgi:hypothetical protein
VGEKSPGNNNGDDCYNNKIYNNSWNEIFNHSVREWCRPYTIRSISVERGGFYELDIMNEWEYTSFRLALYTNWHLKACTDIRLHVQASQFRPLCLSTSWTQQWQITTLNTSSSLIIAIYVTSNCINKILENCPSRMTGKSKVVLKKIYFIGKYNKTAYRI